MLHSRHTMRSSMPMALFLVFVPTMAVGSPLGGDNCDVHEAEPIHQQVAVESPESGFVDPENVIDCFYEEFADEPLCTGTTNGAML